MLDNAQTSDFTKIREIGVGNGGVVHLVQHKSSKLEMARKVNDINYIYKNKITLLCVEMYNRWVMVRDPSIIRFRFYTFQNLVIP